MHKKEENKEDGHNGTWSLETDFHLYFQLQGSELQREIGIHLSSFIFLLGFRGSEVCWFILITNLRCSEVKDGSLVFFSCFIT